MAIFNSLRCERAFHGTRPTLAPLGEARRSLIREAQQAQLQPLREWTLSDIRDSQPWHHESTISTNLR